MPTDDQEPKETLEPTQKKSKTPTWVGKIVKAKDEQIEAVKELADEKEAFIRERLEKEFEERQHRSKALYEIAEQRAADQATTIKRLWIANIIQAFIIAALSGVTVMGKIPFIGDIGLNAPEKAEKVEKNK